MLKQGEIEMKLLYVEVINCSQEPNAKILEESENKKIRYDFDYKTVSNETLKSGKVVQTTKILQAKSKVKLNAGLQFLEIDDGVFGNNYWLLVKATHQKIGK